MKQKIAFNSTVCTGLFVLVLSLQALAVNPFLPPWEYIPDGEPRVFGDRLYLYGSHDKAGSKTFCDTILKVWSAPLSDLNNWRDEGVSFSTRTYGQRPDDVPWSDNDLYAPDVVEKDGKYYLYAYVVGAPEAVAVSDHPGGPFKLISKVKAPAGAPNDFGGWGQYIDPGVLVDDDGKVYLYWGYKSSHMAELNPGNMVEVLPDSYIADIIPTDPPFNFFEGASPRKINGTYYLIYADGGILVYATSDAPTGPFKYGGPIIRNGTNYPGGNIHGSLMNLNGQWYIFYHRMTHNTIMSRKACVEKVTIEPDGSIKEVEMTSLGFEESLNPYQLTGAYTACVLIGGNYIIEVNKTTHPVILNKNGCVIGFKYFDFGTHAEDDITAFFAKVRPGQTAGKMEIWLDSWEADAGTKIGTVAIEPSDDKSWTDVSTDVKLVNGRHALYFKFIADDGGKTICDLNSFFFSKEPYNREK